jgi:hypothetical protein
VLKRSEVRLKRDGKLDLRVEGLVIPGPSRGHAGSNRDAGRNLPTLVSAEPQGWAHSVGSTPTTPAPRTCLLVARLQPSCEEVVENARPGSRYLCDQLANAPRVAVDLHVDERLDARESGNPGKPLQAGVPEPPVDELVARVNLPGSETRIAGPF